MPRRLRTWGRTRKGAQAVDVYSEGRAVFLYDESQAAPIRESRALFTPLTVESAFSNAALRALAAEGRLFVYEQPGDSGVSLEILVGPPLTPKETSKLRWLRPQQAWLTLRSGRLRVDSWDTLPGALHSTPPHEENEEQGALVEVPPGDYRVTLHRVDTDATSRKLNVDLDGPAEVITLTPLGPAEVRPEAPPLLAYEGSADASWPGRYTIEGGTFKGLALFSGPASQILLNLDRAAAARLSLHAGMGLRIRVSHPALVSEAFLTSDQTSTAVFSMTGETLKAVRAFGDWREEASDAVPGDVAAGEWIRPADWFAAFRARLPPEAQAVEILRFTRLGESTRIAPELQMEWLPAEVEILRHPNLPPEYLTRAGLA
jgi:hypothetical protein